MRFGDLARYKVIKGDEFRERPAPQSPLVLVLAVGLTVLCSKESSTMQW